MFFLKQSNLLASCILIARDLIAETFGNLSKDFPASREFRDFLKTDSEFGFALMQNQPGLVLSEVKEHQDSVI